MIKNAHDISIISAPNMYGLPTSRIKLDIRPVWQKLRDFVKGLDCSYTFYDYSLYEVLTIKFTQTRPVYNWDAFLDAMDADYVQYVISNDLLKNTGWALDKIPYADWYLDDPYYIDEVDQYVQRVIKDFPYILAQFKNIISSFIYDLKQVHSEDLGLVKRLSNILLPILKITDKYNVFYVKDYTITAGYDRYSYSSSTGNRSTSTPQGQCDYHSKVLYLNTKMLEVFYNPQWVKHAIIHVYWHELGHAIDYVQSKQLIYKDSDSLRLTCHSYATPFKRTVLNNEHAWRRVKREARRGKFVDYFCRSKELDEIPVSYAKYNSNTDNNYLTTYPKNIDHSQPQTETWAEAMAILLRLMSVGFNEYDVYALRGRTSKSRVVIKSIINSIRYLLKHVEWTVFGIPAEKIGIKKHNINLFLDYIEKMPVINVHTRLHHWHLLPFKVSNFTHLKKQASRYM